MSQPVITICSSANFYREASLIRDDLEQLGLRIIVPTTADRMKASDDYEVAHYKTWFADPDDYDRKAFLMREHFAKVLEADAILVINNEKHGQPNYIGGNVLMEMALAFHHNLPIYLLNDIPHESPFAEEIIGMGSIPLHGDHKRLDGIFAPTL
jgi:hypothetical protein